MSCEHYENALTDAAAIGAEPLGELRAHLVECASCSASFAEEQALFAGIDSSLRSAVNTEVPPSLLPRVRLGLDEIVSPQPHLNLGWTVVVSAAFVSALLFFAYAIRQNPFTVHPIESAKNQSGTPKITESAHGPLVSTPSGKSGLHSLRPRAVVRSSLLPELPLSARSVPEVLVPHDQELLLASYARQWSSRKRAPLIAGDANQSAVALLEVSLIQIPELDVKPLAEGNSQ